MDPKSLKFWCGKRRVDIFRRMISDCQDNEKCIITEGRIWIYACDPERDQLKEYREESEPSPEKADHSKIKVMSSFL